MVNTPLGLRNSEVEIHERSDLDLADDFYWRLLDESQKREIKDPGERYIFSVIYGMPDAESAMAADCFSPRREFFRQYLNWQLPWIDTAAYYIGVMKKLSDPRHSSELVEQITKEIGPDYNLYILAREPGFMEPKPNDIPDSANRIIRKYFRSLKISREIYRQNPALLEPVNPAN